MTTQTTVRPDLNSPEQYMLGNYFLGYDDKVNQINLQFFINLDNGVEVDEMIKAPIPITEDWLLKIGFIKRGDTGQYFIGNNTLSINDNGYLFWMSESFGKVFKYVHQLQNLCNVLEIKLIAAGYMQIKQKGGEK